MNSILWHFYNSRRHIPCFISSNVRYIATAAAFYLVAYYVFEWMNEQERKKRSVLRERIYGNMCIHIGNAVVLHELVWVHNHKQLLRPCGNV